MADKAPDVPDRRVHRTHRMLREALIKLILARGWDATSVRDVCNLADVGRSTFYTHFADKEELLVSGFDEFRKELRARFPKAGAGTKPLSFARGMMEHAHEHQPLVRVLLGKGSGQLVLERFRGLVMDLVREDLATLAPPGPHLDATVHYVTGGFLELLSWWLDKPGQRDASDVEAVFHRLTAPVLTSLRSPPR